jgi:hypothetical protein
MSKSNCRCYAEGLLDPLLNSAYVITLLSKKTYRPRQRPAQLEHNSGATSGK